MHPEQQHLNIIRDILDSGYLSSGRNGNTKSLFVKSMEFLLNAEMNDGGVSFDLPYSTTSGTWTKGLVEEFTSFVIHGESDSKLLEAKGVNIWKPNTQHTDGIIGPAYGHNYRNYGGDYSSLGIIRNGIDQVSEVIKSLKETPNGRRHIILNYDPRVNDLAVLHPCQMLFQFYVDSNGLTVHSYNRSSDICCAGMWNTGYAAMLCAYIGLHAGIVPYKVIMTFGNVHVYEVQEELAKTHITRIPYAKFPRMTINGADNCISIDHVDKSAYYPAIKYPLVA